MKRITFTYTFILCLVSVFIVPKICVGYDTMWHTYHNEQEGRYKDIKEHETELIEAKAAVTDLNNAWSKIQTAKMEGEEAAIDAVANFAIGLVTTALTKGGGAITYAPSVFNGYTAAKANANVTATNTSSQSTLSL